MLTALGIENFKGIGRELRVELRPITLLFGANSAGKSSILHAIHYAREILEYENCDPDTTDLGGPFVDLGGFSNLVHLHEYKDRQVVLRFWVDLEGRPLSAHAQQPYRWPELLDYNNNLHTRINDFSVTIEVGWSHRDQCPIVKRFALDVNGESVGSLQVAEDDRRVDVRGINFGHPLLMYNWHNEIGSQGVEQTDEIIEEFYQNLEEFERIECSYLRSSALPPWNDALWLEFEGIDVIEPYIGGTLIYRLTALFVGLGQILRTELTPLRYLGPIRETPPRVYAVPLTQDLSRWATGLAAWDKLTEGDQNFLSEVNHWMELVGTKSAVEIQEFKELPLESSLMATIRGRNVVDDVDSLISEVSELPTRKRLTILDLDRQITVAPVDVGIGISQVVPVIAAAVEDADDLVRRVVIIEQPELHVHPAVQVELGDLFAWRASSRRGVCIVETHSEHLMLRLLRRIEETHSGELEPGKPKLTPEQVSVIYIEQVDGEVRATRLRIDETGEFVDRWPKGFFEEREDELF